MLVLVLKLDKESVTVFKSATELTEQNVQRTGPKKYPGLIRNNSAIHEEDNVMAECMNVP